MDGVRRYAAGVFILVSLMVSFAGAAVPEDTRQAWPIVTSPELNATGINITNHSIPARYEISPTLIDVRVEVSGTLLPGPKGEMAAGPRTIGFTTDPITLALLVLAIIAGAAGVWYLVKRKPEEPEDENKAGRE
jgi:hypothetical protein